MTRTTPRLLPLAAVMLMALLMVLVAPATPAHAASFGASGQTIAGWFNADRAAYGEPVAFRYGDVPDGERAAQQSFTATGLYGESVTTVMTRRYGQNNNLPYYMRGHLSQDMADDPELAVYMTVSASCNDSTQNWTISVQVESRYDLATGGSTSSSWKGNDFMPCGGAPEPEPTREPEPEPTREPEPEPTRNPEPAPTREPSPQPTREPSPQPTREPQPSREPTREPQPDAEPTRAPASTPEQSADGPDEAAADEQERPSQGGAQVPSNVEQDVPMGTQSEQDEDTSTTVGETKRPSRPSSGTAAEVGQEAADADNVTVLTANEVAAPAQEVPGTQVPVWMLLVGSTVLAMLALVTVLLVRRERAD